MGFRTVFVKNGDKLNLKLDNLEVTKENEHFTIPLLDIENIILEGDLTIVTTRLLAKLAENHIDVVVCDHKYLPAGIYLGMGQYHHTAKRNIWQSQWNDELKQKAWSHVIYQKMSNQVDVAKTMNIEMNRITKMQKLTNQIELGDKTNREGHVAKVYFNSLFGNDFSREDKIFPNFCLDYGYAIIRAQMARATVSEGLIPSLGIFHKNEYNAFNLVDDLMEPFRPIMDYYILKNILGQDSQYLTYEIRLQLIDFLNQKITINKKQIYINQAINDFVNSFIKCMEKEDFSNLIQIQVDNFKGVIESEV